MFKKAALLSILLINALLNMHLAVANDAQTVEVISETQCSFAV